MSDCGILLTFYKEEDAKKVWDGLQDKNGEFSLKMLLSIINPKEYEENTKENDFLLFKCILNYYLNKCGFCSTSNPELEGKIIKFQAFEGVPSPEFLQALSETFNVEFTIIAWGYPGKCFEGSVIPIRYPNFHPKHKYYKWDNNIDYYVDI